MCDRVHNTPLYVMFNFYHSGIKIARRKVHYPNKGMFIDRFCFKCKIFFHQLFEFFGLSHFLYIADGVSRETFLTIQNFELEL